MDVYRDSSKTIDARVRDLLARMDLEEKLAQMGSIFAPPLMEGDKFSPHRAASIIPHGVGHISAVARSLQVWRREKWPNSTIRPSDF